MRKRKRERERLIVFVALWRLTSSAELLGTVLYDWQP
jgi:hypothetical protein